MGEGEEEREEEAEVVLKVNEFRINSQWPGRCYELQLADAAMHTPEWDLLLLRAATSQTGRVALFGPFNLNGGWLECSEHL